MRFIYFITWEKAQVFNCPPSASLTVGSNTVKTDIAMRKIIIWTLLIILIGNGLWWVKRTIFNGVTRNSISENGFKAKYFKIDDSIKKTAVIALGGDEWCDFWCDRLAGNGHIGMSLSYFNQEGLPSRMEEIPLEYFEKAIDWLRSQPEVDTSKVLVMGSGRDAELALLLASTYPDKIHGVIGYCPGSVHWSNTVFSWNSDEIKPSWTLNGQAIPFIKMEKIRGGVNETIDGLAYWNSGLDDTLQVNNSIIKVENVAGPILLITPTDDQLWPSYRMSKMIEKRLRKYDFKYKVQNIQYENAGHRLRLPLHKALTAEQIDIEIDGKTYGCNLGGTPIGNFKAQLDSRDKVDEFVYKLSLR